MAETLRDIRPPVVLAAMPLKLALVGAPFSGKSSVAMSLAQEYGLQIITPEGAVERAVAAGRAADEASQKRQSQEGDAGAEDGRKSEEEEEGEEEGGSKEEVNPEVVKIGQRCLDLTTEGEEIPDELIVRLIAIEIGELGARLAKVRARALSCGDGQGEGRAVLHESGLASSVDSAQPAPAVLRLGTHLGLG